MASVALPAPAVHPMPPLTAREAYVQRQITKLENTPYDEIRAKWGDLKLKREPESIWSGNLTPAEEHYNMGFDRPYYAYQAKSHALCVLNTLPAVPAKVAKCVYHLFTSCCSSQSADMLGRDVKDLLKAGKFLLLGSVYCVGNGVFALVVDPLVFLYRYIDRNFINPGPRAALLIVDPEYDFCPAGDILIDGKLCHYEGGTLAVPGAWEIFPVINKLTKIFKGTIVGCQDWHPLFHGSFAKMLGGSAQGLSTLNGRPQVKWPIHCVQKSRGSKYVDPLDQSRIKLIVKKGLKQNVDSYSAFYDNDEKTKTRLTEELKDRYGVTIFFTTGLAYDYCVGFSALDAVKDGFDVTVIQDATRGVDIPAGNYDAMTAKLLAKGVKIVNSADLIGTRFFPAPPVTA